MTLLDKVKNISIKDFSYDLPDARIAKYPVDPRDHSQLLLYRDGEISRSQFKNLPQYLPENSLLVYNNTKVIRARMFFRKETGAQIEIFCLEPLMPADYAQNFQAQGSCEWLCLVGNLKKWKGGKLHRQLSLNGQDVVFSAEHVGVEDKAQRIRFSWTPAEIPFGDLLEQAGQIPIPPYLNRESQQSDERSYQTVYSRIEGSVAAPTAGLHFTPAVLQSIDDKQIKRQEVTLHVSASTFQPVKSEQMDGHPMHLEFISVEASLIEDLLKYEGRITAVGTTSVRTLESLYWFGVHLLESNTMQSNSVEESVWTLHQWYPYEDHQDYSMQQALQALLDDMRAKGETQFTASTRLLIAPGYTFRVVSDIITNFHQPQSTLLLLVSAYVGEDWRKIYDYAMANDFRFLSYGDSSLLQVRKAQ
ncbi:MAG: S-adenosylmethionine:tRNA ribosyltransferase-isomerase [Bacteroidales bacterium]|nr:S-adenosylmethionine:tRNA ribosyltransferase-isomerase [Bacteroidales bacterium]